MIKNWKNLSIQTLIATSYSITIVLVIALIGSVSVMITTRTVDENTNEYVQQLVNQITFDIEYYLDNTEDSLQAIKTSQEISPYFKDATIDQSMKMDISKRLNDYLISRSDAVNVFLVRKDGEILANEGGYTLKSEVDLPTAFYTGPNQDDELLMSISNAHIQNIIIDRYKWVVSCSMPIWDEETNTFLGTALIDLNFNHIEDILNHVNLGEKGYMFIVDVKGDIVYHPKHELIYSGIRDEATDLIINSEDGNISTMEDGRKKNYIISTSEYSGWKVVGAVYEDELNPYDRVTGQIYTLVIGLALFLAILVSAIISRRFLHPIKDLSDGMHQFKEGNLDTVVHIKEDNEFGDLADSFNDMTQRIKMLVETNKQSEKAKRKYELKSLQAQINPHFLYNTLDSIVWMAEAEMNREVVTMTDSLAKLFRISINKGSGFVTIAQEFEHIESYLKIQKLRYGDQLNYEITADKTLFPLRIVKIIIQPIVENAIYHGIKMLAEPGLIQISAIDAGHYLKIIVKDNGVGMDETTLKKLLNPNANFNTSKSGIGVLNVDQRIKLYYGDDYGITINSEVFEGTEVTMTLPKVMIKEVDDHEEK